jgi:Zn finger protein HypA/HybF involved in hydrogenase expression
MHDGCTGTFSSGKQIADKVRQMGFDQQLMPMPFDIKCSNCGNVFSMERFETHCPDCDMVYAVTPCHAFDSANILAAGIGY